MATLYDQADKNVRLSYFYIFLFSLFAIGVGYVFSYVYDSYLILVGAIIFAVFLSFTSYYFSDQIALSLNRAKPITPDSHRQIYQLVENLCITAGLPVPRIYLLPEKALNAFATGRDPEHAALALTQGLVDRLDKPELEGVIAHELAHIGNRDILLSSVVIVLVGFITLLSDSFRRWGFFFGFGGRRRDDSGGGNQIMFIVAILLSVFAPIAAVLAQLAISRKREYLADAKGALLTRYPDGLADALEKISHDDVRMEVRNQTTAPLFITNPLRKPGQTTKKLFSSHPPLEERIKILRDMAK